MQCKQDFNWSLKLTLTGAFQYKHETDKFDDLCVPLTNRIIVYNPQHLLQGNKLNAKHICKSHKEIESHLLY